MPLASAVPTARLSSAGSEQGIALSQRAEDVTPLLVFPQRTLAIPLRLSPLLCVLSSLAHLLPLLVLFAPEVALTVRLAVIVLVVTSAGFSLRAFHSRRRAHLLLTPDEGMILQGGPERVSEPVTLAGHVDLGALIVIQLRQADDRLKYYALMFDGMPADTWRTLRKTVRWQTPETMA